ncbi:MAG: sugar transferase [Candidatus Sabulitectum sp.]|nr:sugar transferase [Candidatus Sabulitectum sp.]
MFAPIRRQQRILILFLIASDIVTVPVSLLATWYIRTCWLSGILPEFSHTINTYLATIPVLFILWIASWWSAGMYVYSFQQGVFPGLARRMRAVFYLAVSIMAASYLVKMDYSRIMLLIFLLISQPVNILLRKLFTFLALRVAPFKESPATLVIGSGEFAERVINSLKKFPEPRHRVKGVLLEKAGTTSEICGVRVIGEARDLPRLIESLSIDEVFFASGSMSRTDMLKIINSVQKEDIVFMLVTDLFEIVAGASDLSSISRMPVVEIGSSGKGTFSNLTKRVMDLFMSPLLIVVLAPLMGAVWAILALTGKGSPIFKQTRVGRYGRKFILYKFRTMKPEANEYEVAPVARDDPRVTGIGRLLRKTSLDELPQLFNVLLGHMSMVGPRPEMDFIVHDYNAWQRRRLDVKPGITGLWQIMGRKDLPLHENLEYDFYYMRNQSVMLDMAILARTVITVLKGRGAY